MRASGRCAGAAVVVTVNLGEVEKQKASSLCASFSATTEAFSAPIAPNDASGCGDAVPPVGVLE